MRPSIVSGPTPVHRINVTPIIDVALVLVIVLLVTAPLLTVPELEVYLPSARTRDLDHDEILMVTVDPAGAVAVNEEIVARDALKTDLRARLEEDDRVVVVRADTSLPHGLVESVIDDVRGAGAGRIAIATTHKVPK